jgi:hypothetical protein
MNDTESTYQYKPVRESSIVHSLMTQGHSAQDFVHLVYLHIFIVVARTHGIAAFVCTTSIPQKVTRAFETFYFFNMFMFGQNIFDYDVASIHMASTAIYHQAGAAC